MNPITMNLVADDIIRFALREDMNAGNISTESVCPAPREARVQLIAKGEGVIAGMDVFARTFALLDPATTFDALVSEGEQVAPGQLLGTVRGDARVLLSGERVALNFLQRMSGIATYHAPHGPRPRGDVDHAGRYAQDHALPAHLREGRRRGGWRAQPSLQPLAGRHAQGQPYRRRRRIAAAAVAGARRHAPFVCTVEVECEDLGMVREAIDAGADIIMLDNMDREQIREAVALIDGRAKVEVSGNVDADNIRALADLGVDIISSVPSPIPRPILDLSLKHLELL